MANRYDKISLCDTYGNHLKDCIDAGPTIIHNNIEETGKSLCVGLNTEKEKSDYLDFLYSKNIKQAYLTDGGKETYCSNFDYHFKVKLPEVKSLDPTGSGDSFVAGIIYGWHNNLTFENSLLVASSLGIANAISFDTSNALLKDAEAFNNSISIQPIGKKMKIVDVSPD
jgi:tagatose 6-phosphate kinase